MYGNSAFYPACNISKKEKSQGVKFWPLMVLTFFLLVANFLTPVIVSFFMAVLVAFSAGVWVFSRNKIPKHFLNITLPFVLLICAGFSGFYYNKVFDVLKDGWYILNPMLSLMAGFVLVYNLNGKLSRFLSVFVLIGVLVSLTHLVKFVLNPELLGYSANNVRDMAGRGHLISVLAIGLLLASWKLKERWFWFGRSLDIVFFLICLASVVLSFSRELFLSLFLVVSVVLGWLAFTNFKRVLILGVLGIFAFLIILMIPKPAVIGQNASVIDKILYSTSELAIEDYKSVSEVNIKWRGYETARALKEYANGEYWQYLIGRGLGHPVDLGFTMTMGEGKIRYAPILHNGYMFLLVKTGIVGVLIYLLMLLFIFNVGNAMSRSNEESVKYTGRLIVALICIIFTSTFFIAGLFNKTVLISLAILLGGALASSSANSSKSLAAVDSKSLSSP